MMVKFYTMIHATQRFKLTAVVTESDTIDPVLGRGNTTTRDFVTTGKVYFANWWQNLLTYPKGPTYGMVWLLLSWNR